MTDNKVMFHLENLRRGTKAVAYKAYDVAKGSFLEKMKKYPDKIDVWQPGIPPEVISNEKLDKMITILEKEEIESFDRNPHTHIKELKNQIKEMFDEVKYKPGKAVGGLSKDEKTLREKIEFLGYISDLRKERKKITKQVEESSKEIDQLNAREGYYKNADKIDDLVSTCKYSRRCDHASPSQTNAD